MFDLPRLLGVGLAVLAIGCGSAIAEDFTVGVVSGPAGGRVILPIELAGTEAPVAVQFDVLYGDRGVSSEPAVRGLATSGHTVRSRLLSEGRRRVLIFSSPVAEIPDGVIVEIPFSIPENLEPDTDLVSLVDIRIALADASSSGQEPQVTSGELTTEEALEPPQLADFSLSDEGEFTLRLTGAEGESFAVDWSEDLKTWTPLSTIQISGGDATATDSGLTGKKKRFYRVRRVP